MSRTQVETEAYQPLFNFKKWIVQRRARRGLKQSIPLEDFQTLDQWLVDAMPLAKSLVPAPDGVSLKEWQVACYADHLLTDNVTYAAQIETLTHWCIQAMKTEAGRQSVVDWISFRFPERRDYQQLIPIEVVDERAHEKRLQHSQQVVRDGFDLTTSPWSHAQIMDEAYYCLYCHENGNDFCSKGFPDTASEQIFKQNPLGNCLTGCPLDEKISEMQWLKREGHVIAALAMIMRDNPMCPATGHRICNDCMKACIYQKQSPVDTPQIETRVLTDVLELSFGVEIYHLLTCWNPLRQQQYLPKPYSGKKVMIVGMGPAGFTLAHHLLMEGFAVVGVDGLKIEPIDQRLLNQPIRHYDEIKERLSERLITGFGGVAEYGITARWDKNFLKLIYLTLMRRPYFQCFGGVRFGGNITVERCWALGFDHLTIAVGAGLPRALSIRGSLAPGIRQANDFLMALQLTGAAKSNSLANLQIRLPLLVVGSGLTAVDAATEAQAYYIKQVEKFLWQYETLVAYYGEARVAEQIELADQPLLEEYLQHGRAIRLCRQQAAAAKETPNLTALIHEWGGVTIIYRRSMTESPAYRTNHEELSNALREGVRYLEGLQPEQACMDEAGYLEALICRRRIKDETGAWCESEAFCTLPAKSLLVATGARLNIAYEFEHQGTFKREGLQYEPHEWREGKLHGVVEADHVKAPHFGAFTSYHHDGRCVSFVGDSHPLFHGSVVKAIASSARTYPKITELLNSQATPQNGLAYQDFARKMADGFNSSVMAVRRCHAHIIELTLRAPMIAEVLQPGQFIRLQNFAHDAPTIDRSPLQTEALALLVFEVEVAAGTFKVMIHERGVSSRLCARFQPGQAIALMGPTGVRSKIPDNQSTILVVGGVLSLAYIRAVGPAWRAAGNRVLYFAALDEADEWYCQSSIEQATDQISLAVGSGQLPRMTRAGDCASYGDMMSLFRHLLEEESGKYLLSQVNRVTVIGQSLLLRQFRKLYETDLTSCFKSSVRIFASAYVPMQCMLKGVCSQCLQWQIDPDSGQRRKAVYGCSWQDQPLELIDIDNIEQRLMQNRLSENLTQLWLDYLLTLE